MLEQIRIENYKSIKQLAVDVGRFNVLIGENGAGKSNFLEALAVYGAVEANKFDHEFLASRGIRALPSDDMIAKFENSKLEAIISIDDFEFKAVIRKKCDADSYGGYSKLMGSRNLDDTPPEVLGLPEDLKRELEALLRGSKGLNPREIFNFSKRIEDVGKRDQFMELMIERLSKAMSVNKRRLDFFCIYTPENSALRNLEKEGQILPLGVNGEGLYRLLQVMQQDEPDAFKDVMECLEVFDWIELDDNDQCAVSINDAKSEMIQKIRIKDRYLISELDQRSANEGFLFVLFYAALFCSKHTPKIFAIDNIDASLNPRLCQKLTEKLVKLARKYDKQVFVTTHNPAILDGLDLHDPEQALFVVNRNRHGHTQLKRLTVENLPKALTENQDVNRLSEAFIRGYLGGLPSNF